MATANKSKTIVPPFGMEFDHPRNADFVLQAIPGLRIRSAISPTTTNIDGTIKTMVDKSSGASPPETPGMQIHVNPEELTYVIIDPMYEDKGRCELVKAYINKVSMVEIETIQGVPPQEGKLDVHRIKTLCRELLWIMKEGHAKIVKGPTPLMEDVEELAGDYLLNPGLRVHSTQPTFEKDWDRWVEMLTRAGG